MITIKGINLKSFSVSKEEEGQKISLIYQLISSTDKILATQSMGNGYGETPISLSPDCQLALNKFIAFLKEDLNKLLGIEVSS